MRPRPPAERARLLLLVAAALFLNLWVSLLCGWLFWQVGLLSAMLAHMLFHLIWYPFDRRWSAR